MYDDAVKELPYRRLLAWQRAHALALAVLDVAERPPVARQFYLRDQLCSCAMSVPANIAEGSGRGTSADFASFIDRARGSLFELDMWLLTLWKRGSLTEDEYEHHLRDILEINAMLFALRGSLRNGEMAVRREV
jgi:four helix bundle protein